MTMNFFFNGSRRSRVYNNYYVIPRVSSNRDRQFFFFFYHFFIVQSKPAGTTPFYTLRISCPTCITVSTAVRSDLGVCRRFCRGTPLDHSNEKNGTTSTQRPCACRTADAHERNIKSYCYVFSHTFRTYRYDSR